MDNPIKPLVLKFIGDSNDLDYVKNIAEVAVMGEFENIARNIIANELYGIIRYQEDRDSVDNDLTILEAAEEVYREESKPDSIDFYGKVFQARLGKNSREEILLHHVKGNYSYTEALINSEFFELYEDGIDDSTVFDLFWEYVPEEVFSSKFVDVDYDYNQEIEEGFVHELSSAVLDIIMGDDDDELDDDELSLVINNSATLTEKFLNTDIGRQVPVPDRKIPRDLNTKVSELPPAYVIDQSTVILIANLYEEIFGKQSVVGKTYYAIVADSRKKIPSLYGDSARSKNSTNYEGSLLFVFPEDAYRTLNKLKASQDLPEHVSVARVRVISHNDENGYIIRYADNHKEIDPVKAALSQIRA